MIWVQFLITATVVVLAAQRLARYGDVIAFRTQLGGMFVGTLLLAAATSLPELLTTVSAINQSVPSLAAGNIFGSCMFNMFMLALLDLMLFRRRVLRAVLLNHAISGGMAVLLGSLTLFFILADLDVGIGWIGLDSILLMSIYLGGVWLLRENNPSRGPDIDDTPVAGVPSLRQGLTGFVLATAVLVVVTPVLVHSAAGIAEAAGVSAGFVGATLVAVVTSLPELVTTLSAARIGAYDLAIGNLFGSNCFNIFILGITDLFYFKGFFLSSIDEVMLLAAVLGVLLTAMGLFGNVTRMERRVFLVEIDALAIGVTYLFGTWLLYTRGLLG